MKFFNDVDIARSLMYSDKLKGRTKIVLTDKDTGKEEVFEESNVVTNAVKSIFEHNYLGCIPYYSMLPIWHLFGGVMCFQNAITENANTFYPPNSVSNPMIANAGQTAHSTASTTRGNPNGAATEIVDNHITLAWDWALNQGNGTINTVALCNEIFGDVGMKPETTDRLVTSYGIMSGDINHFQANVLSAPRTAAAWVVYPRRFDSNGHGICVSAYDTTFTELTVAHSWSNAELLDSNVIYPATNYRTISSRTATLSRSFSEGYTCIGEDDTYYYVMERDSSSATTLYVDKVAKADMTVTSVTLNTTTSLERTLFYGDSSGNNGVQSGIVSGDYIYWRKSDNSTLVKISMSDASDNTDLTVHGVWKHTPQVTGADKYFYTPFVMSDGLIIANTWLINGDDLYQTQNRNLATGENAYALRSQTVAYTNDKSPFLYRAGIGDGNTYDYNSACGLLIPYLATINTLESAVTKTSAKTMRILYTLTTS